MDQTNNSIPTPNPVPTPAAPVTPPAEPVTPPVMPSEPTVPPVVPPMAPAGPAAPATPPVEPVAPVVPPVASVEPVVSPVESAVPENPVAVNPIINPTAGGASSIYQDNEMLGATDPITMPAPPKAPDPEEVELNAPMKANAPVPGSIGSAISMPAESIQTQVDPMINTFDNNPAVRTPSVAFNDPAAETPVNNMAPTSNKKKMSKGTLIGLVVGAAVLVIILIVILVLMMAG